jgi:hypothetical protein
LHVQSDGIKGPSVADMVKSGNAFAIVILGVLLAAGCTQMTTRKVPNQAIWSSKHIFVERRLSDNYGVAEDIARELRAMGYDASSGALTMMPAGTELIVSYDDMWTWDFSTYLIEFDVQVRNARNDKIVAMGHYFRPSMVFGHAPDVMIRELLAKLFKHA